MNALTARGLTILAAAAAVTVLVAGAARAPHAPVVREAAGVEVVVALRAPSLTDAAVADRSLHARTFRGGRLDLQAPASVAYVNRLAARQRSLASRIVRAIPSAQVRWHYRVLVNGIAVVVPPDALSRLGRVPGVASVYPSVTYERASEPSLNLIGAPTIWNPPFDSLGAGMKIGIVDDGLDQRHQYFSPAGFTMPAGYPRGQAAFTTAKVIVARAFAPPGSTYAPAKLPFDQQQSEHATHVAGIAAGDADTTATGVPGRGTVPGLSGVAPQAYLGNYKVLGTPTPDVGLDGNAAEIAAGIEAAVADGMDVINLSLGEPEIEPSRDIVTKAIDAAAAAGVIPVVAAGNDRGEFGNGSIDSPGSAARAITAAAVDVGSVPAGFSSAGPTPISLRMKPDVAAPGVSITSSVPSAHGTWAQFSGTSMASPHVAGGAALLRQRHPAWTVAQIKSALVQTAGPARAGGGEPPTTVEGGGVMFLPRADDPKLFAAPTGLSFGLLKPGAKVQVVNLTDAGGGAGQWTATVQQQTSASGVVVFAPPTATVPGPLAVKVVVGAKSPERDLTGFIVLTRGADRRRIPYWFRVERPKLGLDARTPLVRTGTYRGNTAGKPGRVTSYRYPDNPSPFGVATVLAGPEQVFRVRLRKPVANFGAALLTRGSARVHIEPRIVVAGDENRLTGYTGLPINLNPYVENFSAAEPVVGAIRPKAGSYDIVFDTPSRAAAGRFTFRFWIDDNTPPAIRLLKSTVPSGSPLQLSVTDAGSSVDPASLTAAVDGNSASVSYANGQATIKGTPGPGKHTLVFTASDYQEAKNMEDVPKILPNTRVLRTTFTVG